jgi:hypothetical protein
LRPPSRSSTQAIGSPRINNLALCGRREAEASFGKAIGLESRRIAVKNHEMTDQARRVLTAASVRASAVDGKAALVFTAFPGGANVIAVTESVFV